MGAHLIFFIIFTLFSCIILTNQSLPWYSLLSGFQCDTKMAAVFSCMRPPTSKSSHCVSRDGSYGIPKGKAIPPISTLRLLFLSQSSGLFPLTLCFYAIQDSFFSSRPLVPL